MIDFAWYNNSVQLWHYSFNSEYHCSQKIREHDCLAKKFIAPYIEILYILLVLYFWIELSSRIAIAKVSQPKHKPSKNFKMKFVGYRDWNQKLVKDYCRLCTYSILHNGCVFTMYCDFAAVTYFRYFNKNSDASNNRLRSLRIKFRCCQSGT